MSKNFERAYRELAQAEAPDLWDRIEAGLKSRSISSAEELQEVSRMKKKKVFAFRKYSGVIAAAVCVAVILPAVIFIRQTSKGYSLADTTESAGAADEIREDSADSGAETEEICDDAAAWPAEEKAMAGGAAQQTESVQAAEDGAAEKKYSDAAVKEETADLEAEDMIEESGDSLREASTSLLERAETKDGAVLEHVVIKVTEIKEDFYQEEEKLRGAWCTANLQQSADGLSEGEEILIYMPFDFQATLSEGGVFEVDLVTEEANAPSHNYESGGEYSYILQNVRQRIE